MIMDRSMLFWLLFIILLLKLLDTLILLQLVYYRWCSSFTTSCSCFWSCFATSFSHDKIVVHVHKSETSYEPFDDHFRNQYFETELRKHREQLESINTFLPLLLVNSNTNSNRVFSNLQNCPITINYVVDMGSTSGAPGLKNLPPWFFFFFGFQILIIMMTS
jgi:hypothetical protein